MAVAVGQRCVVRIKITDVELRQASDIMATIVSPQGDEKCQDISFDEVSGLVYATVDVNSAGSWSMWLNVRFANEVLYTPVFVFAEVGGDAMPCDAPYIVDVEVSGESVSVTPPKIDVDAVTREEFERLSKDVAEKVDKVKGKGLSTNDYTDADKAEVAKIKDKADQSEVEELGKKLGNISADLLTPTTYAELRTLKEEGKLVQGMRYRITDYVTTTAQSYTQSTEHPFDVIVTALDAHTLSEDALAIQHEGDTYFANSNLAAWELKYNFENDTTKYKWAKAWVEEKPQSWTANTGVIESRNDNGVSTNYTVANVGGKQVYLYKPASVDYLRDKTFYTMEGEVVDSITDVSELAIGTTVNPFEHQYEMYDYDVLFVHRTTGQVVGTAHIYEDWGEDDDGYYSIEIEHNDNYYYLQCKTKEPITINGVTYYEWKADEEDNPASDYVGEKVVINPGTRVDYNGSVDNFYYAFESILPQKNIAVEYMYGDGVLYRSDDLNDEVIYQKYVAPVVGSKGVIYRLTDEFNNSLPFDFKNIQFKLNNVYCYTFDNNGKDTSLSGTISENYFEGYSRGSNLGGCIFQSPNVHHNIIRSPFYENGGSYCKTDFYGNEIIATGKTTGAMRGFRMQVDGSITFCKFLHNGSNASSSYCRLSVSAESTLLNTLLALYASTSNITINGIIYNSNIIGYGGSNTINIGRMGWCDVKLGSSCSIVCTNSQGNTTGAFMGSKFNLASFDTITLTMKTDETSDNTRAYRINADIKATTTVDIKALQAHILYNIAPNSNGVVKVWCAADLVQ